MFLKNNFIIICFLVISCTFFRTCFSIESSLPEGLNYELREEAKHKIHILRVDPKRFRFELVKAHNQVFGRETVRAIARRSNAIGAINAGFFKIGNSDDGKPSGTLLINGIIYSLDKGQQDLLFLDNKTIYLEKARLNIILNSKNTQIVPNAVNQFSRKNEVIFYNNAWGPTTLTPYERNEVLIDKNNVVIKVVKHGNNAIPENGWAISYPADSFRNPLKIGDKINFDIRVEKNGVQNSKIANKTSVVTGIPLLIKNGKMVSDFSEIPIKTFVTLPHARTAIGVGRDNKIVIVVTEHVYKENIANLTLEQAQTILKDKQYFKEKINAMSVSDMLNIIKKNAAAKSKVIGLTIPELVKLMSELGCRQAINLDGGGSSTLFLDGKIMNETVGDEDEAVGKTVLRPVSNAIVIIKR